MADKKVTQLTDLVTVQAVDLFHVVDDPSGTPINKKSQLKMFLITYHLGRFKLNFTIYYRRWFNISAIDVTTPLQSRRNFSTALTLGDGANGQIKLS